MVAENSFDIVSKINMSEVTNAVSQAMKEIGQRFDFKGSKSNITQEKDALVVVSDDEYKLKSVIDILQTKLVKRGVPLKNLSFGTITDEHRAESAKSWGWKEVATSAFVLIVILGGAPDEVPEKYALYSPIDYVNPGCPPTLLIQGEDDLITSVDATRQLYQKQTSSFSPTPTTMPTSAAIPGARAEV